jgi:transcriptional regulator with XRE-family HTH domain
MSKKTDTDTTTKALKNLKTIRKARGYTQQGLADELHINVKTYGYYENGITTIPSDILIDLARILDISIDYILGLPNAPLHIGNDEIQKITGLNECSIETLRNLKQLDGTLYQAQLINLSLGGAPLTAFTKGSLSVLNTLLVNYDDFNNFASAFIHYATNEFTHPVHREKQPDGCGKWVPLSDNEFGLATDNSPEDRVTIKINEYQTKAIHKNTLDILINRYADNYRKEVNKKKKVPSLKGTPS